MIKILIAIALLCGAVFLGPRLADSQGFVHIATEGYIVETSLTTAIVIAFVSFIILHILVNLITKTLKLPTTTGKWCRSRKVKKQHRLQSEAFLAYEEGDYERVLNLLRKQGERKNLPMICLLLGAKSAFKAGKNEECSAFLDLAEQSPESDHVACNLLRAKLNLKIHNTEAALELLEKVKASSGNEAAVKKILFKSYKKDQNYQGIKELLPKLQKLNILTAEEVVLWTQKCVAHEVQDLNDPDAINALIGKLSRHERNNCIIMAPLVAKLVSVGDNARAGKMTLNLLRKSDGNEEMLLNSIAKWPSTAPGVLDELLAKLPAKAAGEGADSEKVISVPLLKAAANLELKEGKLNEAKTHLSQALSVEKSRDLYLLAAELNKLLSHYDEASKFLALALRDQELELNS